MTDETCCGACGYPVHATKEMACDWCRQAADRIEALIAELATCEKYRDAYAECDRIGTQAVRDLEAKLAQAEKGLTCIRDGSYGKYASPAAIARTTLAEIKGESHE